MAEPTSKPPLPDPAGLEDTLSPVDLPDDAPGEGAPLRWTSTIVAVAAAFLFLFNAGAVRGWASDLPPDRYAPVIAAADAWHGLTGRLGLTWPVETMRGWWQAAQAAGSGEGAEQEGEPQPDRPQPRPGEGGPPST